MQENAALPLGPNRVFRPGRPARLRSSHRYRGRPQCIQARARGSRPRSRRRRCGPVRRPGRAHGRGGSDRLRRPERRPTRPRPRSRRNRRLPPGAARIAARGRRRCRLRRGRAAGDQRAGSQRDPRRLATASSSGCRRRGPGSISTPSSSRTARRRSQAPSTGRIDPAAALPLLLDDIRAGRLKLEDMLGPAFPLEQADKAFRASLAGEPGRVLVTP